MASPMRYARLYAAFARFGLASEMTFRVNFLVKLSDQGIFVVETKGQEDVDVALKMERLRQWCEDINRVQSGVKYDFVYVDQESFERYQPTSFGSWLMASGNTKRKYNRALGRTVEIRPYEASARKGREMTTG